MELQKLLSSDSDKLTHAKDLEQAQVLIKTLTETVKKLKQEAHLKTLELEKSKTKLSESEFL